MEEYFEKNKVAEKIEFEQAEVYTVKANAEILKQKAEVCGVSLAELGVPMLWNDGKCLVGDRDIISYFEGRLKNNE